ncbi:DUF4352 domain-containing protein, partial [Nonomuraea sp. NN258]|uniref:DUF4352 domain-containing protein n=1 Tax=Nonomuraea antri TaxID=2730852 RepID=UPI0015695896
QQPSADPYARHPSPDPYLRQPPPDPYAAVQQPYGSGVQQPPAVDPFAPQPRLPGYPYGPPPAESHRRNTALVVVLAIGLPLLLLGGCGVFYVTVLNSAAEESGPVYSTSSAQLRDESSADAGQPDTDSGSGPGSDAKGLGATFTLRGLKAGEKMAVTLDKVIPTAEPISKFNAPLAGRRYMAVQLTMTNKGAELYDDAPGSAATVLDGEGQQYRGTFLEVKDGPPLGKFTTIPVGQTRKGLIVFEVPEAAQMVELRFALNNGYAEERGEWRLR